jgi:predicted DNA-binding protein (UPF0251 family)
VSDPKHNPGTRGTARGLVMASDERPEFRGAGALFAAYVRQHGLQAQNIENSGGGPATAESIGQSQAMRAVLPLVVQAALMSVNEDTRHLVAEALRLSFVVGLPQSSVADRMGCDARSVDRYVSTGMQAIRRDALARGLVWDESGPVRTSIVLEERLSYRARMVAGPLSWLTCDEAASVIGIAPRTAREWMQTGRLRSVRRATNRHSRPVLLVASCCVRAEVEQALCECSGEADGWQAVV